MTYFENRQYQTDAINKSKEILKRYGLVYLFGDMRTGKTFIALSIAKELGYKNVLFITKKLAIKSVLKDSIALDIQITCVNYESLPKVGKSFDLVIIDEAHKLKKFPKASLSAKNTYEITKKGLPIIYLSGTPAIESGSGLYHQFKMSIYSPFKQYKNFYKWADAGFVNVKMQRTPYGFTKDYSDANLHKIEPLIKHLVVRITQEDAGFKHTVDVQDVQLDVPTIIEHYTNRILDLRVIEIKNENIVADTPIKLLSKCHQLVGGTIIGDNGLSYILSHYRAEYIRDNFKDNKIAIFYTYKAERQMLLNILTNIVETPEEFNEIPNSIFIGQIKTASEGVNLSTAEYLVFMNIMYSGTAYVQALDRASYKNRETPPKAIFLVSKGGVDTKILKAVRNKQSYNSKMFRRDYEF